MHLAIENFKFLAPFFPLALMAGGGLGAEETLTNLDKKDDPHLSLWQKSRSGIGMSVGFLAIYSSLRLLEIKTGNSGYSKLAALALLANSAYAAASLIHLYKRIDDDLKTLKGRVSLIAHVAAVMISALVGGVGLILFEAISKAYLGHNLSAIYAAAGNNCRLCSLVRKN